MTTRQDVDALIARGLTPVPLAYGSKRPLVKWGRFISSPPPPALVRAWFNNVPANFNVGILTGRAYGGLVVVDFDFKIEYHRWKAQHPEIKTFVVSTARGFHCYFRAQECPEKTAGAVNDGLLVGDLKASGLVTAPPSRHPNGYSVYKIMADLPILQIPSLAYVGITPHFSTRPTIEINDQPPTREHTDGLIAEIKSQISIIWLLRQYTDYLGPSGPGWLIARCPFHNDGRPSMWVSLTRNKCGCFSPSCPANRSMDVIDLYALYNRLGNSAAVYAIAQEIGIL